MVGGSAIRGSRVGAGPMGEAERGDAAPRLALPHFCANGHRDASGVCGGRRCAGHLGLPAMRASGQSRLGEPAATAQDPAVQDAPGLCEGASHRRRGCGHPGRKRWTLCVPAASAGEVIY